MKKYVVYGALLALAACGSPPPPKGVKVGKPYDINGTTYYPAYDPTYDETGIASWYGPGFHGKSTANGEEFDTHDLTAAHPTLPMPSLVRVTNLENGKAVIVRVNDRGPFARGRIIDLSKVAAQRLGITGLAKVRVQYLAKESEQYIAAVAEGRRIDMFAYNEQVENDKSATILAATAPSDQSFIVESHVQQAQPGDTVVSAVPVVSVSGSDLPVKGAKKSGGNIFIREAVAEEVVLTPPTSSDASAEAEDEENRVEVPARSTRVTPGIFIQVGSFSQPENAQKMKRTIAAIAPAEVMEVEVTGHRWWRLRAGPFATHDEAQSALTHIRNQGAADARIITQ